MPVVPTLIDGLFVVDAPTLLDSRGFFRESYNAGELAAAIGRPVVFRQSNHSRSAPGVLRGFHAEPWDKLLYVVRGTALCAVADVRHGSPTYGTALTFLLGDDPGVRRRLFVPRGLANAFQAVTETDYVNDVSEAFDPRDRRGVAWDDPTLAVGWPIVPPILSDVDRAQPRLEPASAADE